MTGLEASESDRVTGLQRLMFVCIEGEDVMFSSFNLCPNMMLAGDQSRLIYDIYFCKERRPCE